MTERFCSACELDVTPRPGGARMGDEGMLVCPYCECTVGPQPGPATGLDVRSENGQRWLYTTTPFRLSCGATVTTETRQPLTSLDDVMTELGITQADLDALPDDDT